MLSVTEGVLFNYILKILRYHEMSEYDNRLRKMLLMIYKDKYYVFLQ